MFPSVASQLNADCITLYDKTIFTNTVNILRANLFTIKIYYSLYRVLLNNNSKREDGGEFGVNEILIIFKDIVFVICRIDVFNEHKLLLRMTQQ